MPQVRAATGSTANRGNRSRLQKPSTTTTSSGLAEPRYKRSELTTARPNMALAPGKGTPRRSNGRPGRQAPPPPSPLWRPSPMPYPRPDGSTFFETESPRWQTGNSIHDSAGSACGKTRWRVTYYPAPSPSTPAPSSSLISRLRKRVIELSRPAHPTVAVPQSPASKRSGNRDRPARVAALMPECGTRPHLCAACHIWRHTTPSAAPA